jgi:hypothetical protein
MTEYNVYKLNYSAAEDKDEYVFVKKLEINEANIETREKIKDTEYYRISLTSGKTYIVGE